MGHALPPTIDAVAAQRWAGRAVPQSAQSPWLHEEIARRMAQRLPIIVKPPQSWLDWEPLNGGLQGHELVRQQYPDAQCFGLLEHAHQAGVAIKTIAKPWWTVQRWRQSPVQWLAAGQALAQPVQMVWANMALHAAANPQALLQRWYDSLQVDGFVMFSCLGPDTLRELRNLYAQAGFGPMGHELTDMHDWGDMLVHTGFAEPVMDMERITLSYSSPQALLQELRTLGRNLHVGRFTGLRTPRWRQLLYSRMQQALVPAGQDRLTITFEVVYGHAYKPKPRLAVQEQTAISLEQMRAMLGHKAPR
ncbi:biotin synthase [Curvibacter sp. CHRR-16]|uniref:biotin synthase n=1 Tax=Curvibacter sp. CHRR-16 TaxID=2835872 RepID=UPI001BD97498|nr:biotin synthase [Curvibacter sp. CHRR-16]